MRTAPPKHNFIPSSPLLQLLSQKLVQRVEWHQTRHWLTWMSQEWRRKGWISWFDVGFGGDLFYERCDYLSSNVFPCYFGDVEWRFGRKEKHFWISWMDITFVCFLMSGYRAAPLIFLASLYDITNDNGINFDSLWQLCLLVFAVVCWRFGNEDMMMMLTPLMNYSIIFRFSSKIISSIFDWMTERASVSQLSLCWLMAVLAAGGRMDDGRARRAEGGGGLVPIFSCA